MISRTLLAAAVLGLAPVAGANAATVTQTQNLITDGQDFVFSFTGITNFVGGALVTIASGAGLTPGLDLSGGFPAEDEYFDVTFDGAAQGAFSCGGPSSVGATAITGATDNSFNYNDCAFSLPLAIDAATFAALAADGMLDVGVLFGADVSTFGHNDEVVVSLSYDTMAAVPLPASALLLGAGMAGLGMIGRRKKRST